MEAICDCVIFSVCIICLTSLAIAVIQAKRSVVIKKLEVAETYAKEKYEGDIKFE